jgi:transcriptional regulator with XRE-family HTH domain
MSFGETLARLREAVGMTQAQLAQRAGVSIDTLRGWEHKRHLPRIDDAFRLARALGVSLDKLILAADVEPEAPPAGQGGTPRKPRKGRGAK